MFAGGRQVLLRVLSARNPGIFGPSAARESFGHFWSGARDFRFLSGYFPLRGGEFRVLGCDFRFVRGGERGGLTGDFRVTRGDDFLLHGGDFRFGGGGGDSGSFREDAEDLEAAEAELLDSAEPLFPVSAQRICLVHPDVRGPARRNARVTESHVAEAVSLVQALPGWSVVKTLVFPTKDYDSPRVFGTGRFRELTETIRACADITSVFLNVERMKPATKKALEAAWGVAVFDRFTLVLHVFRVGARTKEAKLQLALAEIPLLRSTLCSRSVGQDTHGHGSRNMLRSGESYTQRRLRALRDREARIRHMLQRVQEERSLVRRERTRRGLPVVAVVGYTNCGKTSLVRALTGDTTLRPRDQVFATLDVTAHVGSLPSGTRVLYVDTVGFLSQLPHALIQAFSATLEDVALSDVILHVRDVSHPDTALQKETVESTLRVLHLPPERLESMVEVHNKMDLLPGYRPAEPGIVAVSALLGRGLEELKALLDEHVLRVTGRRVLSVQVSLGGPQLRWLYREATVQHMEELPETGSAHVTVIISHAAYGRFRKLFPDITC